MSQKNPPSAGIFLDINTAINKSLTKKKNKNVIPAQAGIYCPAGTAKNVCDAVDPRLRGDDKGS